MPDFPGLQSEAVLTGILPTIKNTPTSGPLFQAGFGGTGNVGIDSALPAGYSSWQISPDIWLGVALNSPFGLSSHFPESFAGRTYAGDASLKTYNVAPSVAYRVNDQLSLAVGIQIQYMDVNVVQGIGPIAPIPAVPGIFPGFPGLAPNIATLHGGGWGYGFTLGAELKPLPGTSIGIGYRSSINQTINGSEAVPAPVLALSSLGLASTPGSASTTVDLPGSVSIGLRQQIRSDLTFLATIEWTNWSRIGTSTLVQPNGSPALIAGNAIRYAFQYRDSWFVSAGAEYQIADDFALRAGLGFERSPISDQVRIPLLPDNDKIWLAVGGTWNVTPHVALDLAYSHGFVKSAPITVAPGNPNLISACSPTGCSPIVYTGVVDGQADLVSIGIRYH